MNGFDFKVLDDKSKKVFFNGQEISIKDSIKVADWSSDFNWGYNGAGPRQLALAVLLRFGVTKEIIFDATTKFLDDIVASKNQNESWKFSERELTNWLIENGYNLRVLMMTEGKYLVSYEYGSQNPQKKTKLIYVPTFTSYEEFLRILEEKNIDEVYITLCNLQPE